MLIPINPSSAGCHGYQLKLIITLHRHPRPDWRAERKLNAETFGVTNYRGNGYYRGYRGYNRGYNSRGYNNNRGGGGYYNNRGYNRGYNSRGNNNTRGYGNSRGTSQVAD